MSWYLSKGESILPTKTEIEYFYSVIEIWTFNQCSRQKTTMESASDNHWIILFWNSKIKITSVDCIIFSYVPLKFECVLKDAFCSFVLVHAERNISCSYISGLPYLYKFSYIKYFDGAQASMFMSLSVVSARRRGKVWIIQEYEQVLLSFCDFCQWLAVIDVYLRGQCHSA